MNYADYFKKAYKKPLPKEYKEPVVDYKDTARLRKRIPVEWDFRNMPAKK